MENRDLFILIILVIIIGVGLTWQERSYVTNTEVSITTDKKDYQKNSILKLAIRNNLAKSICFSSCYPYYLEKKDGGWDIYSYSKCSDSDINDICLSANQSKFFEINLSFIAAGLHRLAIPVCLNCKDKDSFKEDSKFYSNEFSVK